MSIPTTSELFETYKAAFEAKFGQTTPLNERSFIQVLSAQLAAGNIGNYKAQAYAEKQVFATTATGDNLDVMGADWSLTRTPAEAAQFTITMDAAYGAELPVTVDFVGITNGVRYSVDAPATETGGVITAQVTAKTSGVVGNLNVGDQMQISAALPDIGSQATITVQTNIGADEESDDDFKVRILDKKQGTSGGGNSTDYRAWAQAVANVDRAYPFNGNPVTDLSESLPLERTVYVKADETIDPDGIPTTAILDAVRDALNTDPDTGISRDLLGQVDELLYVEPITRTPLDVNIIGLSVNAALETQIKDEIETALEAYFLAKEPYVDGLDATTNKKDTVTSGDISKTIIDVVSAYGGTIETTTFELASVVKTTYTVNPNQLLKLGSIIYA